MMLRAIWVLTLALVGSAVLIGQTPQARPAETISISGRVVDQTSAPFANLAVSLDIPGSSAPAATTKTNQNGDFTFLALPPREYELHFRSLGFKPHQVLVSALKDANVGTVVLEAAPTDVDGVTVEARSAPLWESQITQTLKPQSDQKEPIKTTLCQVVASPDSFNGKIVQFRAVVGTGPESSVLRDESCFADVWLSMGDDWTPPAQEFAYMQRFWDFRTPEKLAWKPVPPLQPVVLRRDKAYRRFWKLVDKQCKSKGRKSAFFHCPVYQVMVTFTGRFDYSDGKLIVTRDVESKRIVGIGSIRFGHLGAWNSQLVVQSVSDPMATPIEPAEAATK